MLLLSLFAAVACYFDYRERRIPNLLLLMLLTAGLIRACSLEGSLGPPAYVLRMVLVILAFYPFYKIGGLGAGDVKLFGIAAGFFENRQVITFLFFSLLFAALISLLKLIFRNKLKKHADTVALAGPVLCGVLLKMGGFY